MRVGGLFLGLLALAIPLAAQNNVVATFDAGERTWYISNGLIEAEFRLNENNLFRIQTLRRAGGGRQWVGGARPASSPIYLQVDDQTLDQTTPWELLSTQAEVAARDGQRHVIQLRNDAAKAEVTLRLEMHPGQPFLRMSYSYRNLDSTRHYVTEARFFNLRLATERRAIRIFHVNQYRGGTPLMFDTVERDLGQQPNRTVTLWAGSHADQCTWLAVRDAADNGLVLGWEFNGRAYLNAGLTPFRERLDIWGGPLESHVPVEPGRELNVPAAFLGLFEGDWDEAGYRTHRYVESVLALPPPDGNFPYLMFNSWGYGQNLDEATLRRAAQIAAQIGVEVFVVDLGWARRIGDWEEDTGKFPGGLSALADYVRSLGMKFGLHFVPVEADPESSVLTRNPDWTSSNNDNYFDAHSLCVSNVPAQFWLRRTMRGIIERYRPDWITQDAENLVKECIKDSHTHDPFNSNWSNSVGGIDSFIRYIRAVAPQTLWENNADGGTMSTFEAVKHYTTFSSCDACGHLERRQSVYGMSYVFSPRYIDRYMDEPPIKFTTRSSMFGGPWILMQRITEWTPAEIGLVRQEAAIYKSLRGLIREGKVHHLLGRPDGHSIEAIESFHPEQDRGVIFVYRPDSPVTSQTIVPRGLNPNRNYRVTFQESRDTVTASGAVLMSRGINVRLPTWNFAEIVYITGF